MMNLSPPLTILCGLSHYSFEEFSQFIDKNIFSKNSAVENLLLSLPFVFLEKAKEEGAIRERSLGIEHFLGLDRESFVAPIAHKLVEELKINFTFIGHKKWQRVNGGSNRKLADELTEAFKLDLTPLLCLDAAKVGEWKELLREIKEIVPAKNLSKVIIVCQGAAAHELPKIISYCRNLLETEWSASLAQLVSVVAELSIYSCFAYTPWYECGSDGFCLTLNTLSTPAVEEYFRCLHLFKGRSDLKTALLPSDLITEEEEEKAFAETKLKDVSLRNYICDLTPLLTAVMAPSKFDRSKESYLRNYICDRSPLLKGEETEEPFAAEGWLADEERQPPLPIKMLEETVEYEAVQESLSAAVEESYREKSGTIRRIEESFSLEEKERAASAPLILEGEKGLPETAEEEEILLSEQAELQEALPADSEPEGDYSPEEQAFLALTPEDLKNAQEELLERMKSGDLTEEEKSLIKAVEEEVAPGDYSNKPQNPDVLSTKAIKPVKSKKNK